MPTEFENRFLCLLHLSLCAVNELTFKRFYAILKAEKSILNGGTRMTKDIVKSVVDKADPIGLLGMCCPADEYDSEIEIIFARIRQGMSFMPCFLKCSVSQLTLSSVIPWHAKCSHLTADHTFDHLRLRTARILCREEHSKAVNPDAKAPKSP